MTVKFIWATPDAEKLIGYMARVSNPANQSNENVENLIRYMVKHSHFSPFEMVSACFEINTTRDIARQILRHKSFSFQEFSQRYADVNTLPEVQLRECRLQDTKNRQNSTETLDVGLHDWWAHAQGLVEQIALAKYEEALRRGIAKEQARVLLPEGLTPSRMYMAGTLRSWMHYCQLRTGPETQKEHRLIAEGISAEMAKLFPVAWKALM
jgi:thymidylate synthase (FAD)